MDKQAEIHERAAQLYPYQLPDFGEKLIEQYGTADDLKQWQTAETEARQQIEAGESVPQRINVTLNEVYTRAEHRFYEDTLRGDYDLFRELVRKTVSEFRLENEVYIISFEGSEPTKEEFIMILSMKMNPLLNAERYFGWDKVTNEQGESCTLQHILDRTEQLFPGARAEFHEKMEQLRLYGDRPEQTNEKPGNDNAKKKHYSIIAKPEHFAFPLDNVNHKAFEGLLMGLDKSTGKPHKVTMKAAGKQKNGVSVYVSISLDGLELSEPLDIIDGDLLSMIYSYMLKDNGEISLCRVLESYGQPRPTEKQLNDAHKRLKKLQNADITIDCKEWAKLKKRNTYSIYKQRILDGIAFEEIRNERTGALLDVILHCTIPVYNLPLYQFADISNQLTHIPMKEAMITGDNSITPKTAAIRHILLERIVRKHNDDKSGKIVLLSTIYEKIGSETKTERSRARKQVENFMKEWVKSGRLYGFSFRKSGKNIDAVVFARNEAEMKEAKAENPDLEGWLSR